MTACAQQLVQVLYGPSRSCGSCSSTEEMHLQRQFPTGEPASRFRPWDLLPLFEDAGVRRALAVHEHLVKIWCFPNQHGHLLLSSRASVAIKPDILISLRYGTNNSSASAAPHCDGCQSYPGAQQRSVDREQHGRR